MRRTMIAIGAALLLISLLRPLHAQEHTPVPAGAYLGPLPLELDLHNRNGYTLHFNTWAGHIYLYNNNLDMGKWINTQKSALIDSALQEAKKYATTHNYKYYAIDHIRFQVTHMENRTALFLDCNVVVWN